jgi:hypothetical protein
MVQVTARRRALTDEERAGMLSYFSDVAVE